MYVRLGFLGGVPALLVPDNLKSAVTKASRYEPTINQTYADLAIHYNTAILPARPYKPKDKAKVENAVLIVERWILARLRHQTFVGLTELNAAITELLKELNHRQFKKLPGTRASQFAAIDMPALGALPKHPYEFARFWMLEFTWIIMLKSMVTITAYRINLLNSLLPFG